MVSQVINKEAKAAKPINILLAEDNEDDIELTKIAFEEAKIKNALFVVKNGQEALDYLKGVGPYVDREQFPMPRLMLLDINMPKMGGLELLEKIKADERLRMIPVIMLTSSRNEEDVVKSYGRGASAFLPKPVDHDEFVKVINDFNLFWHLVEFPPIDYI